MKNRLEYKYLVPYTSLDQLRKDLLLYLRRDAYSDRRTEQEYIVRSIYYDTVHYSCYYEKLDGVHSRNKFRIRAYNDFSPESDVFTEIKHKYDNFISKSRARVPYDRMMATLKGATDHIQPQPGEEANFERFHYYYHLRSLEPKILVTYHREAYECKFGSQLRITIDKNVRSKPVRELNSLFDDDGLISANHREFIFEIKFFQVLPKWICTVLDKYNLTRIAVSKYTSSIDAHPGSIMRFNKFNRPLTTVRIS